MSLDIPDFSPYIRTGNTPDMTLEVSKIIIEILGGIQSAQCEFEAGDFYAKKLIMGGEKAIVVRYKKSNGEFRPAFYMSYDIKDDGVYISEIQGSKERKVSYKFYAGFEVQRFIFTFLEANFLSQGIAVHIEAVPCGLEGASYSSRAPDMYENLRKKLSERNLLIHR